MKRIERILVMMAVMAMIVGSGFAQGKVDEDRMQRDIEVAENILSTLVKQQFDKRSFFPVEIKGNYRAGYGVTFQLPSELTGPMFYQSWSDGPGNISYTFSTDEWDEMPNEFEDFATEGVVIQKDKSSADKARAEAEKNKKDQEKKNATVITNGRAGVNRGVGRTGSFAGVGRARNQNTDSLKDQASARMLTAAKEFIADYGDLISQLAPNEKIVITNRGEGNQNWFGAYNFENRNPYLSVEGLKSDIAQFRQGKITRDQLMGKLKVINTESENDLHPDLELLTSIFNRLYRSDLSKTYFTQDNTYYERLKDYGVIYYMQVYSASPNNYDGFEMPTLSLRNVDSDTRNKKVKELYPQFTKSIKEDILEYARTLKSLKDEESVIFNIKLTRCKGCDIPTWVEYTIKYGTLKDYANGKLSKEAALEKMTEKRGELQ
jgi:hypothetical protein